MIRLSVNGLIKAMQELPEAIEYPEDELIYTTLEQIDPEAKEKPTTLRNIRVIFQKNHRGTGWNLVFADNAY